MQIIEPTEAEIQAEIPYARNSWQQARDQIIHRRNAEAQRNKPIAHEVDGEPWRIEPTADEIFTEMQNRSVSHETARENLKRRLIEDAKHLIEAMPQARDDIANALNAADAARQKAGDLIESQHAMLGELKQRISLLGVLRVKILQVKALNLSEIQETTLAKDALKNYLLNLSNPSIRAESAFLAVIQNLSFRKILKPHIPPFFEKFQAEATALLEQIQSIAAENKIGLLAVLEQMKAAPEHFDQFPNWVNAGLYDGLI